MTQVGVHNTVAIDSAKVRRCGPASAVVAATPGSAPRASAPATASGPRPDPAALCCPGCIGERSLLKLYNLILTGKDLGAAGSGASVDRSAEFVR